MVTMKQLAELCGVSRGTVDRALNGRGRVNRKTAEKVRRMAQQTGYAPNPAGRALAARKNRPVVGVILSSEGNPFFDEVIRGMRDAAAGYAIYGLEVRYCTMQGYDIERQCDLISELKESANAIIINPIDDGRVAALLSGCMAEGMFVVTVNNDLEAGHRHCYVGTDYFNGGETACALMEILAGHSARLGIVMGSRKVLGHRRRLEGFRSRMERLPGYRILEIVENEDDEIRSYDRTKAMLAEHPDITAVFLAAGGVCGACRAVREVPEERRPIVIAFDSVPSTVEMMRQGIVRAVLYQHPYRQGHLSMELAFEYLVNGREPARREYILKNEIRLLENL